jgi:hypothetical protein
MPFKLRLSASETVQVGRRRVRERVSVPVLGGGRTWVSAGTSTWLGWLSGSAPLGGRKPRRRS